MGVSGSFESGGVANCKENIERSGGSAILLEGNYRSSGKAETLPDEYKGTRETGSNFYFEASPDLFFYSGVMANGVILKGNYANADGS